MKKSPMLLKLGLLFETGYDEATERGSPTFVAFQHKSFQDFSAGLHIKKRLEIAENVKVNYFQKGNRCKDGDIVSMCTE